MRESASAAINVIIDGVPQSAAAGTTILTMCRNAGVDVPTLCYLETLAPVNACRICVVEVEGSRTLVPACSRRAEEGMAIRTGTDRVRHSRRLILEMLDSSVDLSLSGPEMKASMKEYEVRPGRFGAASRPHAAGERDRARAGHHEHPGAGAATVAQPVKVDNNLYVRDYARCVLCYKCVEACGDDAQNTFAIAVAGRGFDARIATEFDAPLPDSACVYCGNCIGVCPTGALMFTTEHEMRRDGTWDETKQTVTSTICPYCGVGCNLDLRVQDNRIVTVGSPHDSGVTRGMLCVKGRFGFEFVQTKEPEGAAPAEPPKARREGE